MIALGCLGLVLAGCGDDETSGEQPAAEGSRNAPPTELIGSAARGRERARIVAGFDAYMGALAAGDFKAACDRLAAPARRALERAGSRQGGGGCPQALSEFWGDTRQGAGREIEKVRVDGDTAQVISSAPDGTQQAARLYRESGEWRAGLLSVPFSPPSS